EIQRARKFYREAERGISLLNPDARWPVWSALVLYSKILSVIEDNGYDVFNKRAYVPTLNKLWCLPGSLVRSRIL
ncbi:MAG: squalene/phytoene synthase family protein, partial [Cyanobacteria bacterium J06636_16]